MTAGTACTPPPAASAACSTNCCRSLAAPVPAAGAGPLADTQCRASRKPSGSRGGGNSSVRAAAWRDARRPLAASTRSVLCGFPSAPRDAPPRRCPPDALLTSIMATSAPRGQAEAQGGLIPPDPRGPAGKDQQWQQRTHASSACPHGRGRVATDGRGGGGWGRERRHPHVSVNDVLRHGHVDRQSPAGCDRAVQWSRATCRSGASQPWSHC